MFKKRNEKKPPKKLFRLTLIVIPTIIVVIATVIVLNINGVFMSAEEKLIGSFTRQRIGEFSKEQYTETYVFSNDGTGTKTYIAPNGEVSHANFSWYVTPKDILVMNGHVKYQLKSNYKEYYNDTAKSTTKYWYVSKDALYLGENTAITYEEYKRD